MKTATKPNLKSKTFLNRKSYTLVREKGLSLIDFKFYQKLFVVFIALSTFLIFPESPTELENICADYNSKKLCSVW